PNTKSQHPPINTNNQQKPQTTPNEQMKEHNPNILLLPHLHYGKNTIDILRTAHQLGIRIVMDCQSTNATLETTGVEEALRSADVFIPNEVEAIRLTRASSAMEALRILSKLTPQVIIKCGKGGAIALLDGKIIHEPAIEVQVVDTTGAGDCFNAGFLYGSLILKAPLSVCLKAANYCGGISTTAVGGSSIPDKSQLDEYLMQTG
ncbi:MAG: carbohydrate kinase family protein, partial [Anaerolineales bacterium]